MSACQLIALPNTLQIESLLNRDKKLLADFKLMAQSRYQLCKNTDETSESIAVKAVTILARKIFRMILSQCATGNFIFTFNGMIPTQIERDFKIQERRESLLNVPPVDQLIQTLFRETYAITMAPCEYESDGWRVTVEETNQFIFLKPQMDWPEDFISEKKRLLESLREEQTDYDVTFLIEGKELKAHKALLMQSNPLKEMINLFSLNTESVLVLELRGFDYELYRALFSFLYVFEIENAETKGVDFFVDLYQIAHSFQVSNLMTYCRMYITKLIDHRSFLKIASLQNSYTDEYLFQLCLWYVFKNYSIGLHADLSHFSKDQLFNTYVIARKYEAVHLERQVITTLMRLRGANSNCDRLLNFLRKISLDLVEQFFRLPPLKGSSLSEG